MSTTILETIAAATKVRVEKARQERSLETVKSEAQRLDADTGFPFEQALRSGDIAFICECKKASPSKGRIAQEFPYLEIAREYEKAGAAAISVLTEPQWFLGSNEILREIAAAVNIPCLRKDFTVDAYMIYEAKTLGAAAVLLICALTEEDALRDYIKICDGLGSQRWSRPMMKGRYKWRFGQVPVSPASIIEIYTILPSMSTTVSACGSWFRRRCFL